MLSYTLEDCHKIIAESRCHCSIFIGCPLVCRLFVALYDFMKCPKCENEIRFSFGLYRKAHFGRFKCPSCKVKLALTSLAKELSCFTIVITILLLIIFYLDPAYKLYGVILWFVTIFTLMPFEYRHYKKQQPSVVGNVT